jgi:hypothetical protein
VLGVLVGAAIYLRVSILVLAVVAIFVFVCWNLTGLIWTWFGSDPHIAHMAGYYARYVRMIRKTLFVLLQR